MKSLLVNFGAGVAFSGVAAVVYCYRRDKKRGYQKPADLSVVTALATILAGALLAAGALALG